MNERSVNPPSKTYTVLFEACHDDDEFLLKIFESCIKHGVLDKKLQLTLGPTDQHVSRNSCAAKYLMSGNEMQIEVLVDSVEMQ
jgi:hypothetical protein